MADPIPLTLTTASNPFVLSASASTEAFILTSSGTSTINLQLGASLVGGVNLVGPSSIKGLSSFVADTPDPDEIVAVGLAPYAYTIHVGNSGAQAVAAATAQTIFTIKRTRGLSTVTIGTITFGIGSATGTIAITDADIHKGDLVAIYAPSISDLTLKDIAFLLAE